MTAASVVATGSYSPADNPFTTNVNEGLPSDGNMVNIFESQTHQTYFEGRHLDGSNPPTDDTNVNFDVMVGITSSGTLLISGESALRDENLYIGGEGMLNGQMRLGSGVVRITGFGSLYNNDPSILPAEVENIPGGFSSQTPRPTDQGFDMYVGQFGSGTLEISAGARAEIQDAVSIGDAAGAIGNVTVDGIDSFLGNGGFDAGGGTSTEIHQMTVGRQGTGFMTISGGATVDSEAPIGTGSGSSNTGTVGAVLGSTPFTNTLGTFPDGGGSGTVTVTGAGSKWTVGGSLQVGGFDIGLEGITIGSIAGEDLPYPSQTGRGTLYVNDGGIVTVRNALNVSPTDITTPLLLAIGRFGVVQLSGGTIHVGNLNASGGTGNQGTPDVVQLINDGVISGSGRIETGVFRNRYLGQIRVNAGESLVIDSSSQFSTTGGATPVEPLSNYGSIQVFGNETTQASLEFVRAPADSMNPVRPFINLPLPTQPTPPAFVGGLISAQWANLRFGSGLQNQSIVAFTAGTNNIAGRVVNLALDSIDTGGDGDAGETTQILVSGPGTTAVFQDDLAFGPGADLNLVDGGKVVVLNQHSFTMAGSIGIELSYSHPSLITVSGDVGIGNPTAVGAYPDLTLNFDSDVLHSLKHGDSFQIISFGGDIGNVDLTDPNNPIPDLTSAPIFADIETSPNIKALYGLDTVIEFSIEGVYATFLDPTMVGSGAMGPDFNGDGVVDGADFAIWQAHVGITGGASVLEGDANGDGRVDGQDFLIWQRNVGKPKPWNGAGSGSGASLAAVPEPTSLVMLLCGGSLAIALGRRRVNR